MAMGLLVLLPQCDWFSKSAEKNADAPSTTAATPQGDEVLLTINGQPRITVAKFEEYMATVLEAQPQLKQLLAFMPDAEYELFKSMSNEELLKAWIEKNKIDQQANYKKDLQMIC